MGDTDAIEVEAFQAMVFSSWPETVDRILGFTYVVAWTFLFYPQLWLNFTSKSVKGISIGYVVYNTWGFGCYMSYNITRQGIQTHFELPPSVSWYDVFFASHAFVCCVLLSLQVVFYDKENQRITRFDLIMACLLVTMLFVAAAAAAGGVIKWYSKESFYCGVNECGFLNRVTFVQVLGFTKVLVTLLKYPSQIRLNCYRKSTRGLALYSYLLDSCGGLCSFAQNVARAVVANDPEYISGNLPKICIGAISFIFDLMILCQVWYYRSMTHKYIRLKDQDQGVELGPIAEGSPETAQAFEDTSGDDSQRSGEKAEKGEKHPNSRLRAVFDPDSP